MSARDESETDDEYDEIGNDSSEGDEFKVKSMFLFKCLRFCGS